MGSIVTARGVSFTLPNGRQLFENLNFSLVQAPTALTGPNGIGKSTLAKILAGQLEPSHGEIHRSNAITFFAQRETPPAISIEAFLTDRWSHLRERLTTGLDMHSQCDQLSGGEWMRVRLARVLDAEFLILDEPTNDLDREGREILLHFLRQHRGGSLLISHDRECLSVCEDVLELSNRGLAKFSGGWLRYVAARNNERENLHRALDVAKRERDFALLERATQREHQAKRNRRGTEDAARGGTPKILLGARKRRAQTTTGKVDHATLERSKEAVRTAHEALQDLKVDPVMYADLIGEKIPSGKLVAEAHEFNVRFRDWIYAQDLNFSWRGGIRLALKGKNGSGKSTLIKFLLGETLETRGRLRRGNLTTLYVDQTCATLDATKTIFENVRQTTMAPESEIRNGLAKFLFTKQSVFQNAGTLSGGERLRAALAMAFLSHEKPELLILDEPTNNLDLVNVEFLENFVREFRGALIVVSHDDIFLKNIGIEQEFVVG